LLIFAEPWKSAICGWPIMLFSKETVMRLTLHILVKDVRGLRWHILLVVALTLAVGYFLYATPYLYGLAQAYLIARVIQDDALAGDRQFWVTRPISWKALLAAKLIFIAVLTTVPVFIAEWAALAHQGLQPASHISGLIWGVASGAVLWLPAAALAAVTRNLAEVAVCLLVTSPFLILPLIIDPSSNWQSLDWARELVITPLYLLIALSVVLLQYSRRRAWPARALLACVLVLPPVLYAASPWDNGIALVFRPASQSGVPGIQIAFDGEPLKQPRSWENAHGMESVYLPLQLLGLPPDTEVSFDAARVEIRSEDGASWRSGWSPWVFPERPRPGTTTRPDRAVVGLSVKPAFLEAVRSSSVNMRVSLAATVFQNDQTVNVTVPANTELDIPGIGVCSYSDQMFHCRSALRLPGDRLAIRAEPGTLCSYGQQRSDSDSYRTVDVRSEYSASPFPVESGSPPGPIRVYSTLLAPASYFRVCAGTEFHVTIQRAIARIRQDLVINNIRLGEYASPQFPR
jgi:hypothetical protein